MRSRLRLFKLQIQQACYFYSFGSPAILFKLMYWNVLSPHLILPVKTRIIFKSLNEVCKQTTFRSETTAVVKTRPKIHTPYITRVIHGICDARWNRHKHMRVQILGHVIKSIIYKQYKKYMIQSMFKIILTIKTKFRVRMLSIFIICY